MHFYNILTVGQFSRKLSHIQIQNSIVECSFGTETCTDDTELSLPDSCTRTDTLESSGDESHTDTEGELFKSQFQP